MEQSSNTSLATTQDIATIVIANINLVGLTLPLKLTKEKNFVWKTQLLPILAAYDLMDLVDQDPPPLSYTDKDDKVCPKPVYKTLFKNDNIVLSIITSSLCESVLPILVAKSMSKEAWMAINRNFAANSRSRVMELQTKLHNLIKGSLSIDAYVQAIGTIEGELQTCGNPMKQNDLTLALLIGLGSQYNTFYASTSQLVENLTFNDVAANLNTFDLHLSRQLTEQVPS